ncbi:hypothetical protein SK128_026278 [Halocaridina rubra]|uniref:Uncharacterized protein n=1 Tax=Halocaridina rubra TaxID=373956 RepID=A0AAN8WIP7_HALRR
MVRSYLLRTSFNWKSRRLKRRKKCNPRDHSVLINHSDLNHNNPEECATCEMDS